MESKSEDVEEDMGEMYLNEVHTVTFDKFGTGKVTRLDSESCGDDVDGWWSTHDAPPTCDLLVSIIVQCGQRSETACVQASITMNISLYPDNY